MRTRRPVSSKREVHALRGVSFVARQGEAVGVIGKNGAGKSTLMRAIAGLLPPNQGAVYADGQPTMLGVSSALMQALSGLRNVELGLLALGLTPAEVRERVPSVIEFSGIGSAIHMPMNTYSSGMSARLKFAIASAVTHEILLIDEALSTGDGEFVKRSSQRIQQLRDEADTIFLVSHSMGAIRSACNRVLWLDEGKIIADGHPDDIIPEYETRFGLQSKKALRERRRKRKEANEQALAELTADQDQD
jgi:teichoic acid transport system ATP-binding protein